MSGSTARDELGERLNELLDERRDLRPRRKSRTRLTSLSEVEVLTLTALRDIRERMSALEDTVEEIHDLAMVPTLRDAVEAEGARVLSPDSENEAPSGTQSEGER